LLRTVTESQEVFLADIDVLEVIVKAVHERHGFDVCAMDMSEFPLTMDVFLLTSAENRIQSRAIADHIERKARDMGRRLHHREGYEEGSWILLDFVDLVIHIFLPETRNYYNLEMLWNDAPSLRYEDESTDGSDNVTE
jgi:ribosome-associated protein